MPTTATASAWPTVGQLLSRTVRLWGDREAAVDGDRRADFRTLAQRSLRLGSGLRARRLGRGERVAILSDNSLEYLEAYFGVPSAGLVLLPLNTRLSPEEISYVLQDSGSTALIVGHGYEEVAATVTADLPVTCIYAGRGENGRGWETYESLLLDGSEQFAEEGEVGDTAYLYYTSGTTGRPKGCMLTHMSVFSGSLSSCATVGLRGGHSWLHAGPMFHLGDAWAIWGVAMLGGRQVMMRFDPVHTLAALSAERITHTLLVPTALEMLSEAASAQGERLADTDAIIYGGAPMPPAVMERLKERLDCPLIHTYGITETSGVCTVLHPHEQEDPATGRSRLDSIGRETPVIQIDVVDEGGNPVAADVVGEVRVTSPAVMQGYWNKPGETAEVLTERSYLTGDMGRRDSEGFLWLADRKKDMIISGGENVYAMEVERVLGMHPAVGEVAVVGIPEDRWGERVCAVVRVASGERLTLDDLQSFAREHLAGYKVPRLLKVVDALPRTGSGKIDKKTVRQQARASSSDAPAAAGS